MVGAPQHALKTKLGIEHSQAAAFQVRSVAMALIQAVRYMWNQFDLKNLVEPALAFLYILSVS